MKQHPTFGALIVKDLPYLEDVISGIRSHHERWDGRGYPDGLSGMQIPIMGRLLAVPDTYSALTTNRPYRKGHTPQEALLEIRRSILTQFDPLIAKTFIEVMKRELRLGDLDDKNAVEKAFTNS
jgi:HD-GYP domain-containing protein (c-di-GMP phosphodiesterase class II)